LRREIAAHPTGKSKDRQRDSTENDMNVSNLLPVRLLTGCCVFLLLAGSGVFAPADAMAQASTKADGAVVGDLDPVPVPLPQASDPEARVRQAWMVLTTAAMDAKHPQTRIQALAALGLLRTSQAEKMLADGMADADLDVRTAAALAAGQSKDPNLTTGLRQLLDDKEPQVAFTAATTLWKMGDRSGEDILLAVVEGDRSASPTLLHGTEHTISRDLHSPSTMARLGALQGASMLLGPFGFGLTAYEYVRRNGGDLSRVNALELIGQERTEPIHQELLSAVTDKDPAVRAAAAKGLADYHDKESSNAVFGLLIDSRNPVRLTGAAAFLRTTGVPGPEAERPVPSKRSLKRKRTSTK
jgi:hypothetical protein